MADYNTGNLVDVRGVMARVEELEGERDGYETPCPLCKGEGESPCEECEGEGQVSGTTASQTAWTDDCQDEALELAQLTELLSELAGAGGDEQWRGEWYPLTLVADHYFTEHAQEEAESLGLTKHTEWPYSCIDWVAAAEMLKQDYQFVEFDGGDWWYR